MKYIQILLLWLMATMVQAQMLKLTGNLPQSEGNEIKLMGYEGFQQKELSKTPCDSLGFFQFSYPKNYIGSAQLQFKESHGIVVLLNGENAKIQWNNVQDMNALRFIDSPENDAFTKGISIYTDAEQKLQGLNYLLPRYQSDREKSRWLQQEISYQQLLFKRFIDQLPTDSYASYYLKVRKFLADMFVASNQQDTVGLCTYEKEFSEIAFADDRLWHSGLMMDLFTGFYQLLNNYGDAKIIRAKADQATDCWIKSLAQDPIKQQEVAVFCFNLLEKLNNTPSSEHLALAMLNQSGCQLDEKRTAMFEQYRKMAVGKTAPDLALPNGKMLSQSSSNYKLVMFGASWCPDCQKDFASLVGTYKRMKEKWNIECVYISLDTDSSAFQTFYKDAPFMMSCDFKGWNGKAVDAYYVVATPTIYLLNEKLQILNKVIHPQQLEEVMKSFKLQDGK